MAGTSDVAKSAVTDAYGTLKGLLKRVFKSKNDEEGVAVLDEYVNNPQANEDLLKQRLKSQGADKDDEVIAAAKAVLANSDPEGFRAGKYDVSVKDSQGVQIGDANIQTNTFGPPNR